MNCVKKFINNNNKILPIIPSSNFNIPKKPSSKCLSLHSSKSKNPKYKFIKNRSRLSISRNTNLTINTSIAQYKS